jgi:hypothetical protein
MKVQKANAIYDFCLRVANLCLNLDIAWSIENPSSSYMWLIAGFIELRQSTKVTANEFHQCMHGGDRAANRCWLSNLAELSETLPARCDGSHPHRPWGAKLIKGRWVFATEEEAPYPELLCIRVAEALQKYARRRGFPEPPSVKLPCSSLPTTSSSADVQQPVRSGNLPHKLRAAATGRVPRGRLLPQVIPEFREQKLLLVDSPVVWALLQGCFTGKKTVSKECASVLPGSESGAKILELRPVSSGGLPGSQLLSKGHALLGLYWSQEQFLKEAKKLVHPFDGPTYAGDLLLLSVFETLTEGPESIRSKRAAFFAKYEQIGRDLQPKEDLLHSMLPQAKQEVLEGKRFLLLQRIADDLGYPDSGLASAGLAGAKLTGMSDVTGAFPLEPREAKLSSQDVMKQAKWIREAAIGSSRSSGDPEIDKELWDTTIDELDRRLLSGPYTREELDARFGPLWTASRRFGLRQGDRIRCIDDLTGSLVNSAFGPSELLDLGGVDGLAALVRALLAGVDDQRIVSLDLSDGTLLRGVLHPSLSLLDARSIVGRTLDLEAAYKQLTVACSSAWASVIVVFSPVHNQPLLYALEALPFGASAAVFFFNRFARCQWFIGVKALALLWTNFYDDFPHVDLQLQAASSHETSIRLFDLLGWRVSLSEKKNKPMCQSFVILGVVFDFSDARSGWFEVHNKTDRVDAIKSLVDGFRSCRALSSHDAASLRGRFQYAEGQLFARLGALMLKPISERAHALGVTAITPEIEEALAWLCNTLLTAAPRRIICQGTRPPLIVFSDGACEGVLFEVVSCGAVLFDPHDSAIEFFGLLVSKAIHDEWTATGIKQVIGQAEIYPVLLAKLVWFRRMMHRRVFFFIDNDSARDALIKYSSGSIPSNNILRACAKADAEVCVFPWYARVSSASNIADLPSRLDFSAISSHHDARQVFPVEPLSLA